MNPEIEMNELIPLSESEQLAPEQWVKLYGVAYNEERVSFKLPEIVTIS